MTVEEVDAVAGPATARARSACFRTADLVGIDTLLHVAKNSYDTLPDDEKRDTFKMPDVMAQMVAKGLLGNKSKQGFFKKTKGEKAETFFYDLASGEYRPSQRPKFPSVEATKGVDDPVARLRAVLGGKDKAAELAWRNLRDTLIYAFNRVPEISDDYAGVDDAMRWGFNWELGPFEMLDAVGVPEFVKRAEADGVAVPPRLRQVDRFYVDEGSQRRTRDPATLAWRDVVRPAGSVDLLLLKKGGAEVERNSGASVVDLGDGVFCLEFHTKMNAIGGDVLAMVHRAVKRAETRGRGARGGEPGRELLGRRQPGDAHHGHRRGRLRRGEPLGLRLPAGHHGPQVRAGPGGVGAARHGAGRGLRGLPALRCGERPGRDLHGPRRDRGGAPAGRRRDQGAGPARGAGGRGRGRRPVPVRLQGLHHHRHGEGVHLRRGGRAARIPAPRATPSPSAPTGWSTTPSRRCSLSR